MLDHSDRIRRLLSIVTLIQGSARWTAQRLAVELGVSVRSIYRDLAILQSSGIPYFFDRAAGGYGIRRDFFMAPVQLTLDEALAMSALVGQLAEGEQVPMLKPATRAIAKVRSVLPAALRDEVQAMERAVAIRVAPRSGDDGIGDVYERIRRAIVDRRALSCTYESVTPGSGGSRSRAPFLFQPYTLLFSQRAWYAIGRHGGHDAVRCLRLNRFTQVTPTDRAYTIPAKFTLESHLGLAWRMIRGKPRCRVRLRFDREFADTIADTHWHATQRVRWRDDGSVDFACTVDGLDEIVWWVLSMGPHCRVLAPPELAARVRALAADVARLYEPST